MLSTPTQLELATQPVDITPSSPTQLEAAMLLWDIKLGMLLRPGQITFALGLEQMSMLVQEPIVFQLDPEL
jgi:hypothetical protein